MLAYLRQIKLVQVYPDRYLDIIHTLTNQVVSLMLKCNAETVSVPIESLSYLARTDPSCAQAMGPVVLAPTLQLLSTFHADAMLSSDILDLIKVLGNVKDSAPFR